MGLILGLDGAPYEEPKKPDPPKHTPLPRKEITRLIRKLNEAKIPSFLIYLEDRKYHINTTMAITNEQLKDLICKHIDEIN